MIATTIKPARPASSRPTKGAQKVTVQCGTQMAEAIGGTPMTATEMVAVPIFNCMDPAWSVRRQILRHLREQAVLPALAAQNLLPKLFGHCVEDQFEGGGMS
jgi:hypothetical protein